MTFMRPVGVASARASPLGLLALLTGGAGPTLVTVYCFGDIDDSAYGFGAAVAGAVTGGG